MSLPEFAHVGRLWLLLLVPALIVIYVLLSRLRSRRGVRFTNTSLLGAVVRPQSQWRRHLAVALSLLSLVTLTLAWAIPQGMMEVPRERATVVVVLDVSRSMAATDVKPDRFTVAKEEAKAFIASVPPQFNVALVTLSGSPAMVIPPTTDRYAVGSAIDRLELKDSTAIGEAIVRGLSALDLAPRDPAKPDEPAPGAIVLLSDGTNTLGRPAMQGAQEAKEAKRKVFTIAYGTENGYVDYEGKRETVPVDRPLMEEIAKATGGQAYVAKNAGQLAEVYRSIGSSMGTEMAKREVTSRYAGYGFGFAVLAALCAISLSARWP